MPQDIDKRTVKPNYSGSMRFPTTVTVPMNVAVCIEGGRRIRIKDANQDLPLLAVEWMENDSRYSSWFDEPVVTRELTNDQPSDDIDLIEEQRIDDLTAIKGVGDSTATRLLVADITTYAQLANLEAARLVEIANSKRLNEEKAAEIIAAAKELA